MEIKAYLGIDNIWKNYVSDSKAPLLLRLEKLILGDGGRRDRGEARRSEAGIIWDFHFGLVF